MTIELLSLDMAGTTVDEQGLVYRVLDATVTDATGSDVPAELLAQWKGTSKREAVAGLLAGLGAETSAAFVTKVFDDFSARLITAYRETPPAPIDGIPEALAGLRARGVKVALQTGYSAAIASAILEGLDWTVGPQTSDTVDALVTSDQVPLSRPAPYLIFRCMETTGVTDVRNVLVAGDTPNDVLAGHQAGAAIVVGVLSGSFDEAALAGLPYTHLLPTLATVAQLI